MESLRMHAGVTVWGLNAVSASTAELRAQHVPSAPQSSGCNDRCSSAQRNTANSAASEKDSRNHSLITNNSSLPGNAQASCSIQACRWSAANSTMPRLIARQSRVAAHPSPRAWLDKERVARSTRLIVCSSFRDKQPRKRARSACFGERFVASCENDDV